MTQTFIVNGVDVLQRIKDLEQENKDFEILAKSLYKRIEELEKENEALAFRERLYKADYEASEQENKELKEYNKRMENQRENYYKEYNKYRSALEEIREKLKYWEVYFCDNCPFQNKSACYKNEKDIGKNICTSVQFIKIQNKINEILK